MVLDNIQEGLDS